MHSVPEIPKYKIVLLGDVYVGKTSIIKQFMSESFDTSYAATVGIDFLSKNIHLPDGTIRLQIWDTAGQEKFYSLIPNYVRDSAASIIVFDLTNSSSFGHVEKWIQDVKEVRGEDAIVVIVGNKQDLTDDRAVSTEEAESKAREYNYTYIETSASDGTNVHKLFSTVAGLLPKTQSEPQMTLKRQEPNSNACRC